MIKTLVCRLPLGIIPMLALFGCGSNPPTTPPTTQPSTPITTPTTTVPPITSLCVPTPPPLHSINVSIHTGSTNLLDSRPLVENIDNYCQRVGIGNGSYCVTRLEGDLQREACDALAVGKAKDTGRYGPTWSYNDLPCMPAGTPGNGCINHETNQFLAKAKGPGNFKACAADDVPVQGDRCGGIIQ